MEVVSTPPGRLPNVLAASVAVLFVLLQTWTANYGAQVNDFPYIRNYDIPASVLSGSALERPLIVAGASAETLDKQMLRFKLYSIDADEMTSIMALARINPAKRQFDPHYYQYGGAWLYPLGAWYAVLDKLGLVHAGGGLTSIAAHPDRMDAIYFYGRMFVILATGLSGLLLFTALREVADWRSALAGMAIFLICPATICFSQTMKPHWYALLFVNAALGVLARSFVRRKLTVRGELVLAGSLGLAVGSAVSFGSFAVLVWLVLLLLVHRHSASWPILFRVPAIALAVFAAMNPYLLADLFSAHSEAERAAAWFSPSFNAAALGDFAWSSILPGFGIALALVLTVISIRELLHPTFGGARPFVVAIVAALLLAAVLTANLSHWPINYRYVAYIFPTSILFIFASRWRAPRWLLVAIVLLTAAQSLPLKLAYVDENDPAHATRMRAAQWINANVPRGTSVCTATPTPAPFSTPPFDLTKYDVNGGNCDIIVRVERYEVDHRTPDGYMVVQRFRPRLSLDGFALIFGHANPLITIYRHA